MKKTILTIAFLLGLGMTSFADGGLFQRGYNAETGKSGYVYFGTKYDFNSKEDAPTPLLPTHGETDNVSAPMGSGIVVLMGLGASYFVGKMRRDE